MVIEQELVGKTKKEALDLLKQQNSKYRIFRENDEYYMISQDYNPNRFNLSITNGKVDKIKMG